jgi:hypothetical protein
MKVFVPSIPFNHKHSVNFIYVNSHNATFPHNQRVLSRQDFLVKTYTHLKHPTHLTRGLLKGPESQTICASHRVDIAHRSIPPDSPKRHNRTVGENMRVVCATGRLWLQVGSYRVCWPMCVVARTKSSFSSTLTKNLIFDG